MVYLLLVNRELVRRSVERQFEPGREAASTGRAPERRSAFRAALAVTLHAVARSIAARERIPADRAPTPGGVSRD